MPLHTQSVKKIKRVLYSRLVLELEPMQTNRFNTLNNRDNSFLLSNLRERGEIFLSLYNILRLEQFHLHCIDFSCYHYLYLYYSSNFN